MLFRLKAPSPSNNTPETPAVDAAIRNELVKSLCVNREKREEISKLRDQLNVFMQNDINSKITSNAPLVKKSIHTSLELLNDERPCDKCATLKCELDTKTKDLDAKTKELEEVIKTYNEEINELRAESMEMKTNMVDMVKEFDGEKTKHDKTQNDAIIQLIDDAKSKIEYELKTRHEEEVHQLQNEIELLNGELLHTKEEYLKLCEEVKNLEEHFRNELNTEKQMEISEIRQQFEDQYQNEFATHDNEMTMKFMQNLECEKNKWMKLNESEIIRRIDQAITLAKVEWLEDYDGRKAEEIRMAIQVAEAQWETATQLKRHSELEERIEKLKEEWMTQQEVHLYHY